MSEQGSRRLDGSYLGFVSGPGREGYLGSVEVEVLGLRGDEDDALRVDALPAMPPGLFSMPREGEPVWVEFLDGDLAAPVWRARTLVPATFPSGVDGEALGDTHVLLHTPGGEKVELDDARGRVRLADRHGNRVRLDEDGVVLADRFGNQVVLGAGGLVLQGAEHRVSLADLISLLVRHTHVEASPSPEAEPEELAWRLARTTDPD